MSVKATLNAVLAGIVLSVTSVSAHGIATGIVVFPTGSLYERLLDPRQFENAC